MMQIFESSRFLSYLWVQAKQVPANLLSAYRTRAKRLGPSYYFIPMKPRPLQCDLWPKAALSFLPGLQTRTLLEVRCTQVIRYCESRLRSVSYLKKCTLPSFPFPVCPLVSDGEDTKGTSKLLRRRKLSEAFR